MQGVPQDVWFTRSNCDKHLPGPNHTVGTLVQAHYRGYFVAPRPEKNAVEGQRMADGFVEDRRLALERYLNRLARHPVLLQSEVSCGRLSRDGGPHP